MRFCRAITVLLVLFLLPVSLAQSASLSLDSSNIRSLYNTDVRSQASQDATAGSIRVSGLSLGPDDRVDLVLEPANPFASDALLRRDGAVMGSLHSDRRYYRGHIEGEPWSIVSLSIDADSHINGLIASQGGHWQLSGEGGALQARFGSDTAPAHKHHGEPDSFECTLAELAKHHPEQRLPSMTRDEIHQAMTTDGGERYRVRLALETTAAFGDQFSSPQAAADYIGGLVNAISAVYEHDLNTEIVISSISMWSDNDSQPWDVSGDTDDMLRDLAAYWGDPSTDADTTAAITHLLDAEGGRRGVAYLNGLCNDTFGFGVNRGMDTQSGDGDPMYWNFLVLAHEVGHNFDSRHTHCYTDSAGGLDPVDRCWNEKDCYQGTRELPGPSGQGSGTIMSYCHLTEPGSGQTDISASFGRNHPYGNAPDRVPDLMRAFVVSRDSTNPRCPQIVSTAAHTVTIEQTGEGSVSPRLQTVEDGESAFLSITPAPGQQIEDSSISGCGGGFLDGNEYTTAAINSDCVVQLAFTELPGARIAAEPGSITATLAEGASGQHSLLLSNQDGDSTLNWSIDSLRVTELEQDFQDVEALIEGDWVVSDTSEPPMSDAFSQWRQGESSLYIAQSGVVDAYLMSWFGATDVGETLSVWMMTPPINLYPETRISLYTRLQQDVGDDQLQLRLSTSGQSSDTGQFDTQLSTVGPNDYPTEWTRQHVELDSVLTDQESGRIAFRRFLDEDSDAGILGIDTLRVYHDYPADDAPWLSVSELSGSVSAGDSESIVLNFDASSLEPGIYQARLRLDSNAVNMPESALSVPLTLQVEPAEHYQVDTSVSGPGSVDPVSQTVTEGSPASIALQPDSGAAVSDATGCGGSIEDDEYRIPEVNGDCTVNVVFETTTPPEEQIFADRFEP